jgi:hypothetical protein
MSTIPAALLVTCWATASGSACNPVRPFRSWPLRTVMPVLPVAAATSASHLGSLTFPADCRRLYIAADADAAGRHGIRRLSQRAGEAGIQALVLRPRLGDFNDDLRQLGPDHLAEWLGDQLVPEDARSFLPSG